MISAGIERDGWEGRTNANPGNGKTKALGVASGHRSRGILRILTKLRRSNSGGLDKDSNPGPHTVAPFTRGGFRSTAAPRLGWNQEPNSFKK